MTPGTPTDRPPACRHLTIADVCVRYPGKGGQPLNRSTPARWITAGCPARDGRRVRLRATRLGSRWLIEPADLEAFFEALAVIPSSPPSVPTPRTDTDRRAAAARASDALARRGA